MGRRQGSTSYMAPGYRRSSLYRSTMNRSEYLQKRERFKTKAAPTQLSARSNTRRLIYTHVETFGRDYEADDEDDDEEWRKYTARRRNVRSDRQIFIVFKTCYTGMIVNIC